MQYSKHSNKEMVYGLGHVMWSWIKKVLEELTSKSRSEGTVTNVDRWTV